MTQTLPASERTAPPRHYPDRTCLRCGTSYTPTGARQEVCSSCRPESDWEVPLSAPIAVEQRLEAILRELGERLNPYEQATEAWIRAKREREKAKASSFLTAKGSVAARNAIADVEAADHGVEQEVAYMAQKAALSVLEAQASACQSLLKSQGQHP